MVIRTWPRNGVSSNLPRGDISVLLTCHRVAYLRKPHYRYVTAWQIWGNPITDMSSRGWFKETPLLICHRVADLRKPHYWYVIAWQIWGNPITDMSLRGRFEETPLLICHRVADFRGGFRGGAPGARPSPLKLEKIWFVGVKSWFFTRNTPKIFTPLSARRNFFMCAPPNLKSWIRPWLLLICHRVANLRKSHYVVYTIGE
jgi:hypothetical protein